MLKLNGNPNGPFWKAAHFFINATLSGLLLVTWGCSGGGGSASTASSPQGSVIDAGLRSIAIGACVVPAGALDCFGPPPEGDPSALTGPLIGLAFAVDALALLPPAFEGAFGGSTEEAAAINNALPAALLTNVNVPTGGKPSPLFGAKSFEQQMLLFEEFGTEPLSEAVPAAAGTFPLPTLGPAPEQDPVDVAMSGPAGAALDAFLGQKGISPFPTQFANTSDQNPWKMEVAAFLGRPLLSPPAEGTASGSRLCAPAVERIQAAGLF